MIAAGAGTGVLGALLGTGGGVFLIPLLVMIFGVPMHYAVATSILSVIATSSAVASGNVARGTANMRLGMTLECATAAGAILGGLSAGFLSPQMLEGLFSLLLLPTAWFMWRGRTESGSSEIPKPAETMLPGGGLPIAESRLSWDGCLIDESGQPIFYRVERLWAGMLVSLVAGSVSGLLGIGGGIFKVPALHILCNVPMKAAAATSNFMIGVTAAASAFLYFGRGEVRPSLTAAVVLGVLAGSGIGLRLNPYVRGTHLRRLFAGLLVIVSLQMAARAFPSLSLFRVFGRWGDL